jgi:hypothetical protein
MFKLAVDSFTLLIVELLDDVLVLGLCFRELFQAGFLCGVQLFVGFQQIVCVVADMRLLYYIWLLKSLGEIFLFQTCLEITRKSPFIRIIGCIRDSFRLLTR